MEESIKSAINEINELPPSINFVKTEHLLVEVDYSISISQIGFHEKVFFKDGLNFSKIIPDIDYKVIEFPNLYTKFNEILQNKNSEEENTEFLTDFVKNILIFRDNKFFELSSIYLYFCQTLKFTEICSSFLMFLDRLMSSDYIVSKQENEQQKQQLISIRARAIEVLISNDFHVLLQKMKIWVLQPDLFQEVCHILAHHAPKYKDLFAKKKFGVVLHDMMKCLFFCSHTDDENIIEAQKSFLYLLDSLSKDEEISQVFVESRPLLALMFSMLPDQSIRPFIFKLLKGKLTHSNAVRDLQQFIEQAISDNNALDVRASKFLVDCLREINSEKDPSEYSSMCNFMKIILNKLEINEESTNILLETIKFFSLVNATPESIMALVTPLMKHKEKYPQNAKDLLANQIVYLLFGKKVDPINSYHNIKNPTAMRVLFLVYNNKDVLDFCNKLCNFSIENICELQKIEFDILLLEELNKIKDDDDSKEMVKAILQTFCNIAVISSSPKTVQELINVLTPTNGLRCMAKFHPLVLSSLSHIFHSISVSPLSFTNMSRPFVAKFTSTNENSFSKGVILTFWCKVVTKETSLLCTFIDKSTSLTITVTTDGISIDRTSINRFISPMRWTFFVIGIDFNGTISVSIDGSIVAKEIKINRLNLANVYFGGTETSYNRIGNISMYPLVHPQDINDTFKDVFKKGPKYVAENCPVLEYVKKEKYNNFSDVFFDVFGVSVLIPLFAHVDLKTKDNESFDILPDLIKTLSSALIANKDGQKSFADDNGFLIIRHLLFYTATTNITFQLYSMFYDLFSQLTYKKLKMQLLETILLNFRLFFAASVADQIMIVEHISAVLFLSHKSVFVDTTSFRYILYNMQIFYTYKPFAKPGAEEFNKDIRNIRMKLFELCVSFAKQKFTIEDFEFAINCFSISNGVNQRELSELLLNVSQFVKKEWTQRVFNRVIRLHFLHNIDDDTTLNVIKIILKLHKICDFKIKLCDQLTLLTRSIFVMKRGEYFLEGLSKIVNNGSPEVFPLFTNALLRIPDMKKIYLVTPSESLVTSPSWCLNVIFKAVNEHDENKDNYALKFLAECAPSQWENILDLIECVCVIEGKPSDLYKTLFLIEASKLVLNNDYTTQDAANLLTLLRAHIFYRKVPYFNEALDNIYKSSLFYEETENEKFKWCSKGETSPWRNFGGDLPEYDNFLEYNLVDTKQVMFAIKVTEQSEWVHLELAEIYVKILLKYRIEDFYAFGYLINAFLVEKDFDFAMYQLSKMNLTDVQKFQFSKYIDFTRFMLAKCKPGMKTVEMKIDLFNSTQKFIDSISSEVAKRQKDSSYVDLYNTIKEESKATCKACEFIFSYIFDCNKEYNRSCNRLSKDEQIMFENGENEWTRLWCNASTLGSPWYFKNEDEVNWKRSRVLCGNFCPMKMKKNKRFNNYRKESYARDIGSLRAAAIKAMKDLQMEQEERMKTAPPKLFTVKVNSAENIQKKTEDEGQELVTRDCILRRVSSNDKCVFKLFKTYLTITSEDGKQRVVQLVDLVLVLLRKVLQRITAIEIFTVDGRTYFIDFESSPMPVIEALNQLNVNKYAIVQTTTDFAEFFSKLGYTTRWANGEITNFEYLMAINIFSCRSFNDPTVYPIFPWTISNFTSEDPELIEENFRDLKKPIGAVGEERLQDLYGRREEMRSFTNDYFLYSSYLVCPLAVYLWLLRLEPFTEQHVQLQGGKFDQATRIFSSVGDTYKMCTSTVNDYRELIPEFYFMSEFLVNSNHFDLGKVRGIQVDDVRLPAWAHSPEEFTYKMRRFLESDIVSENLNNWIDLIWGYKCFGPEAEKADNTYLPQIYEEIWKGNISDMKKMETEAVMSNVGQIPARLFTKPHVKKHRIHRKDDYPQTSFTLNDAPKCAYITTESNNMICILSSTSKSVELYTVTFEQKGIEVNFEKELLVFQNDEYATHIYPKKNVYYLSNKSNVYYGKDSLLRGVTGRVDFSEHYYIASNGTKVELGGPRLRHTIPFYGEKIACLSLSKFFKTFVVCTDSGKLFLGDVFKGTKVKAVSLDYKGSRTKPILSLITHSMGYIITYASLDTRRFVFVHSLNGELIKCVEIFCEITLWSTFTSERGIDYVLFADKNGSLYTFDAFKVDIVKFTIVPGVCCLSYCYKHKMCVVVTENNGEGSILFIPLSI